MSCGSCGGKQPIRISRPAGRSLSKRAIEKKTIRLNARKPIIVATQPANNLNRYRV